MQSNQQQTEKIANKRQLVGFKQSPVYGGIVKTVRIQFAICHHGVQNAEHAFQPISVGENEHFRLKKIMNISGFENCNLVVKRSGCQKGVFGITTRCVSTFVLPFFVLEGLQTIDAKHMRFFTSALISCEV